MQIILGIDTGGTFTDAVLYDLSTQTVLAKAKSPTTREHLETGISKSIAVLCLQNRPAANRISKVVLSTTLATNAIVEEQGHPTGLIIIGDPPKGSLPTVESVQVAGKVNVRGKIITPIDEKEVAEACRLIAPKVEAFAVSGMMSVRNASLELQVKHIIQKNCGLPVVCGYELSSQLGFSDRTVTCILNAGLLPIISDFIQSVQKSLIDCGIRVPVYMIKGDGSLATLDRIQKKPIESILSGPAASMLGAMVLSKADCGIVADMGGTTTDTAVIRNRTLTLSDKGAKVGGWQTQVASAEISTWALGGDTQMICSENHLKSGTDQPVLTGRRILPACRGGKDGLTPTDLLHLSGEFCKWNPKLSEKTAKAQARFCGLKLDHYLKEANTLVIGKINDEILEHYRQHEVEEAPSDYGYIRRIEGRKSNVKNLLTELPVIAIGAPAETWYKKVAKKTGQEVIIPDHYEVANAVGAACAGIEERQTALIRPDEENNQFNAFVAGTVHTFDQLTDAVKWAETTAEKSCIDAAKSQGAEFFETEFEVIETVEKKGLGERFVQTEIRVTTKASALQLK